MKKTLVALSVAAFAASASAVTVYENEGSKFEVDGRVNIAAVKETSKVEKAPTTGHSRLENNGSRIRFTATHAVNDDLSAFGRVELRFNEKNSHKLDTTGKKVESSYEAGSTGWGGVRTHRAYVGLNSKSAGSQVTFGKMLIIGDDIGLIGVDNYFGVGSKLDAIGGQDILTSAANGAVEYRFTGVKGLTVGANYVFADTHDTAGSAKAGYNLGVVYGFDVAEGQKLTASLGYSHTDFQNSADSDNRDKNGIYGGFSFETAQFKVGIDGGRAVTKDKDGDKTNVTSFVRAGAKVKVADKVAVYGNYGYVVVGDEDKDKAHRFMLGSEYQLHKNVKTYVEAKLDRIRYDDKTKQTDKGIGAGLVVLW